MLKGSIAPTRSSDHLSYLWLAIAATLTLVAAGRWSIPLAAWLAPLFLLRFVRTRRVLSGFLAAWLVRAAATAVAAQGTILVPGVGYYAVIVLAALVTTIPFLVDRLITPRLHGFVASLVFPLAFTTIEYLTAFGPNGSYSSIAYTQYGNLPLMQVVSVTGIWGITFLICWCAAVVNWAWEHGFAWPVVRRGIMLYAGLLAAVVLGGGARLAFFPPQAATVRVAGITTSAAAATAFNRQLPQQTLALLLSGKGTQADRALARAAFTTLDNDLFVRTQQEARAGAKIVAWPEASSTSASILQEDEPALIQRAGALAQQEGIYLDMGLAVFLPAAEHGPFLKDEAVLLDPGGKVVWSYEKSHLVPFTEQGLVVQGAGNLPVIASPYGRLANAICYDLDYPATIRQAGQARTDLLLGPADDWKAIDPAHAQKATFRAIENGFSLVRETNTGLSLAVDYEGHVLAEADSFTTEQPAMVAAVPMQGVRTIYALVGDLFAWLCMLGLAAVVVLAILQRRLRRAAAVAAPLPEPQPPR